MTTITPLPRNFAAASNAPSGTPATKAIKAAEPLMRSDSATMAINSLSKPAISASAWAMLSLKNLHAVISSARPFVRPLLLVRPRIRRRALADDQQDGFLGFRAIVVNAAQRNGVTKVPAGIGTVLSRIA